MVNGDLGTVSIGCRVRIKDGELEEEWQVVPDDEADVGRRRISDRSPLGRALLGHAVGEEVRVQSPGGRWPVTILNVDGRPT